MSPELCYATQPILHQIYSGRQAHLRPTVKPQPAKAKFQVAGKLKQPRLLSDKIVDPRPASTRLCECKPVRTKNKLPMPRLRIVGKSTPTIDVSHV